MSGWLGISCFILQLYPLASCCHFPLPAPPVLPVFWPVTPAWWALPCSQCLSTCTSSFRWFSSYFSLCCCCCCQFTCSVFSRVSCHPHVPARVPSASFLCTSACFCISLLFCGIFFVCLFVINLPAFECIVFGSYFQIHDKHSWNVSYVDTPLVHITLRWWFD